MIAADYPLGGILWSIFALYFWFMLIWMFVATFADIFRRSDLSGFGKAIWVFVIFVLPFLGILIYVIARPRVGGEVASPSSTMGAAAPYRVS
jgi:hypothetical protein